MLKKLRVRITALAALLTGAVLAAALGLAFAITREQYQVSRQTAFLAVVNQLQYQWSSFDRLEDQWLFEQERQNGLYIRLEQNGMPLLYSQRAAETKNAVFDVVRKTARQEYQVDCDARPIAGLSQREADFTVPITGRPYRCAVRVLLEPGNSWNTLLVAQDISGEQQYCLQLGAAFIALGGVGLAVLTAACWYVAGRAIEPVRDAMERQQQFLSAAGHELRTPLAVIRANVGAATSQPQNTTRYLKVVDEESARMGGLVDELLLLSAGTSAKQRLSCQLLDPDTFLLDFYESMEPLAVKQNRRLEVQLPDGAVPPILADSYRLRQLLTILLDNALRYAPEQTAVVLQLDVLRDKVCFAVMDHGPGVPDREKKHIFDRFYRGNASTGNRCHYGLGLAVARELTTLHEGKLWVEDAPGGGAKFFLSLKAQTRKK